jgi:hypothetical protein
MPWQVLPEQHRRSHTVTFSTTSGTALQSHSLDLDTHRSYSAVSKKILLSGVPLDFPSRRNEQDNPSSTSLFVSPSLTTLDQGGEPRWSEGAHNSPQILLKFAFTSSQSAAHMASVVSVSSSFCMLLISSSSFQILARRRTILSHNLAILRSRSRG